jgi:hypothetical protein
VYFGGGRYALAYAIMLAEIYTVNHATPLKLTRPTEGEPDWMGSVYRVEPGGAVEHDDAVAEGWLAGTEWKRARRARVVSVVDRRVMRLAGDFEQTL